MARGKPIRQPNMQRLITSRPVTLPVFTVVDEGLISAEMCQDVLPALRHATSVSTINWCAIALLSLNVRSRKLYRALVTTAKPLGADADPDFGIYDAARLDRA